MEYNKTYNSFIEYIDKCRFIINNSIFNTLDIDYLEYDYKISIDNFIKKHRLKMIDIKLEHTNRMLEQIVNINNKLELKPNLDLLIKIAILYHDIGRFSQATWCNTFSDSIYKKKKSIFDNHSEEGYYIFLNNDFNIFEKYIPIISNSILYHQFHHISDKLNYKFNTNLNNINIDNIITGSYFFNEKEWQVASLIVQLVADLDKIDILYQHLTSDFKMIREYVYDTSYNSIEQLAKKWGITPKEIIEYNNLEDKNYEGIKIKIPIVNVSIDKLRIPNYMKEMFYNNNWKELDVLIKDNNWNFITILWWRLSHFLNKIEFVETLVNVYDNNLLEKIYHNIPVRLRPLFEEAFNYSKEVLIEDKIKENKGRIYIKK